MPLARVPRGQLRMDGIQNTFLQTQHPYLVCNVPIFGFPYSTVVDDLMGLCQPDHRGNLRLTVSSGGLEELYDSFRGRSS
jgi:hypothetical protein